MPKRGYSPPDDESSDDESIVETKKSNNSKPANKRLNSPLDKHSKSVKYPEHEVINQRIRDHATKLAREGEFESFAEDIDIDAALQAAYNLWENQVKENVGFFNKNNFSDRKSLILHFIIFSKEFLNKNRIKFAGKFNKAVEEGGFNKKIDELFNDNIAPTYGAPTYGIFGGKKAKSRTAKRRQKKRQTKKKWFGLF